MLKKHIKKMKIKIIIIVAILLVILITISVIQGVQLDSIKGKLSEGGVKISSLSGDSSAIVSKSAPSVGRGNLPQMVGGC